MPYKNNVDSEVVLNLLLAVEENGILKYADISKALGYDVRSRRRALTLARQEALTKHRAVFGTIIKVGLRRLSDSEAVKAGSDHLATIKRGVERAVCILTAVKDFSALDAEKKTLHQVSMMTYAGIYRAVEGRKALEDDIKAHAHHVAILSAAEVFSRA